VDRVVALEEFQITIVNTATIDSDQTPPQSDTVDLSLITVIDPRITKQVDPARAQIGDQVTFVLIVHNYGNANATNVVVRDQLPIDLDLLSASSTRGVVEMAVGAGGVFTVTIDVLGPGEDVFITVHARVNENAHPLPATIHNLATLEFDQGIPRVSDEVTVYIPSQGDGDGGDDDDDDDGGQPTPTPTLYLPVITPTPAVQYLPETGNGCPPVDGPSPAVGLMLMALFLGVLAVLVPAARRR
jgi:uncharacterized repeat protein (TIGR01451 family)